MSGKIKVGSTRIVKRDDKFHPVTLTCGAIREAEVWMRINLILNDGLWADVEYAAIYTEGPFLEGNGVLRKGRIYYQGNMGLYRCGLYRCGMELPHVTTDGEAIREFVKNWNAICDGVSV